MEHDQIYAQALPYEITLYWMRPEGVLGETEYEVFLNGKKTGRTNRTHMTLNALEPQKSYQVEVQSNGKSIGTCLAHTTAVRKKLDIRSFGAAGDGERMDTDKEGVCDGQ